MKTMLLRMASACFSVSPLGDGEADGAQGCSGLDEKNPVIGGTMFYSGVAEVRPRMKTFACTILLLVAGNLSGLAQSPGRAPLKVGVVGLVHDHVHDILSRHGGGDVEIVGITEPNQKLAERYAKQHGFKMDLVFDSIEEMLETVRPEVVSDYSPIYHHLKTVEVCAPRGIHVMVEKPLAVSLEHARKIQTLARRHRIHVLTNYETTWYGSHHRAKRLLADEPSFGPIRKIVVHDGHSGPVEIGCSKEFIEWLTDPHLNGAGALTDFGCYGANLSTWLMNGEKPRTVTAVLQQIKPDVYPHVDDEATVVLVYPGAQAILQASWNWNYSRKDIEVYCTHGYVHCLNRRDMKIMLSQSQQATEEKIEKLQSPYGDPYEYLSGVVRGEIEIRPTDLSALENNVTVVEILEAAKISARELRTVRLEEFSSE